MDVKTVCLGMLTDGDASGYDMKKCFESSFGHFFPAGYGSIYPALATLARNGLVEFELVPQDGKPDRKVYQITGKGREALSDGLSNPHPTHKIRSEFLANDVEVFAMPDINSIHIGRDVGYEIVQHAAVPGVSGTELRKHGQDQD